MKNENLFKGLTKGPLFPMVYIRYLDTFMYRILQIFYVRLNFLSIWIHFLLWWNALTIQDSDFSSLLGTQIKNVFVLQKSMLLQMKSMFRPKL